MEFIPEVRASKSEVDLLAHLFSCTFNSGKKFENWNELYNMVDSDRMQICKIPENIDLAGIFNKIGVNDLCDGEEIYLIDRMPEDVFKVNWEILKKKWDDIWRPPMDDMLILYVPNRVIVLVAHWDMVYYY